MHLTWVQAVSMAREQLGRPGKLEHGSALYKLAKCVFDSAKSPKRKAKSPKRKASSPKRKSPSPKPKSPSPKRKSPSPKPKSPSPKRKSPSPKRKSPSPKRKSPSPKPKPRSPTSDIHDFLIELRDSGRVNMWGATPYLVREFGMTEKAAQSALFAWMDKTR